MGIWCGVLWQSHGLRLFGALLVSVGVFVVLLSRAMLFSMWFTTAALSFRCVIFKFDSFLPPWMLWHGGYEEGDEEGYAEGHEGEGRLQRCRR